MPVACEDLLVCGLFRHIYLCRFCSTSFSFLASWNSKNTTVVVGKIECAVVRNITLHFFLLLSSALHVVFNRSFDFVCVYWGSHNIIIAVKIYDDSWMWRLKIGCSSFFWSSHPLFVFVNRRWSVKYEHFYCHFINIIIVEGNSPKMPFFSHSCIKVFDGKLFFWHHFSALIAMEMHWRV